ncbi:MAG: ATP-dependent sacrificial sulfur transferase LarE, partial [Proteobacteria bacterium]|nr:ATP-dependent sacrificial sulfur transferase LarE [Pseudomonadota bacterium]
VKMKDALGFDAVFEGSNLDDLSDFRPGRKAVEERGVISPLLIAGITKSEVRELSKKYNLPTYNKPSKACLASRIPYGQAISVETLKKIDSAEIYLESLGFSVVRVRAHGDVARIEVKGEDFSRVLELKDNIVNYLLKLGFNYVTLDLEGFRSGSMNRGIGET